MQPSSDRARNSGEPEAFSSKRLSASVRVFQEGALQMKISSRQRGVAVALAGAMALAGATPSLAGPVLSNASGVKAAISDPVVDVRYRHRGSGIGIGAGLAAGALLGAGIAAATAPRYYYGPGYYGGAYAYDYGPGYTYAPAYGAYGSSYAYPYQTCGVSAGYGRWDYSQC
jgi:hypothetical protein